MTVCPAGLARPVQAGPLVRRHGRFVLGQVREGVHVFPGRLGADVGLAQEGLVVVERLPGLLPFVLVVLVFLPFLPRLAFYRIGQLS